MSLAFLIAVVGLMAYFPDTRIALIVGPIWSILIAFYYGKGFHWKETEKTAQKVQIN